MPRDKSISHEKIIQAAKNEFTEYSYDKASMRRIGQRCGLTAAAIYRHFDSKEALFNSIVSPTVENLKNWTEEHIDSTEAGIRALDGRPSFDRLTDIWKEVEKELLTEVIYPDAGIFSMLVNGGSTGNSLSFIDWFAEFHLNRMTAFIESLREKGCNVKDVSEDGLRILIRAYCTAMFEPLAKGQSYEEAKNYYSDIDAFFRAGLKELLGAD